MCKIFCTFAVAFVIVTKIQHHDMTMNEVSPSRLAEYKAINAEVEARAKKLTHEQLHMPEDQWWMGACHVYWQHKKQILRKEYGIVWRSPQDLNPETLFD